MDIIRENIKEPQKRRLTTIVASDICSYSFLSERDELSAIRISDDYFHIFEKVVSNQDGRVFKRVADAFLAEFPSAHQGMQAAIEFTAIIAKLANKPSVRTGIHVGDVIDRPDGDILGHGVNIAVRLQEQSFENGILASLHVVNLLGQNKNLRKERRGSLTLKNIEEPVIAFDIKEFRESATKNKETRWRHRKKVIAYVITATTLLISSFGLHYWNSFSNLKDDAQIADIVSNSFNIEADENGVETLSSSYIRQVLAALSESKIPSQKVAFALIRQGSVGEAVSELEISLNNYDFGSDIYVEIMHQIAALSYHYDPKKASAYYEGLLEIDPTDKTAFLWLFRTYNHLGNSGNAKDIYKYAIQDKTITDRSELRLIMDLAFNQMLNMEFQSGVDLLHEIKEDVRLLKDQRLLLEWQTSLSLALERLDRLEEAEALLVSTIAAYNSISADTNLPRAFNIMGQIQEKKALSNPQQFNQHMNAALDFYRSQYAYGKELNKPVDVAESLYYLGNAYITSKEIAEAKKNLTQSQILSIDHDLTPLIYRNHIGLARTSMTDGYVRTACEHVRRAKKIETDEKAYYISPANKAAYMNLIHSCAA